MRRARGIAGVSLLLSMALSAAQSLRAEDSLGDKIKKIFAPSPTPAPRKHRKGLAAPKAKGDAEEPPSPKPSATPRKLSSPSSSKEKQSSESLASAEKAEASPSVLPKKKDKKKKKKYPPVPEPDSLPGDSGKKEHEPSTSPTPNPGESSAATPEATEPPNLRSSPSPSKKKKGAPATIKITELSGYENYPPNVRKIMDTALDLTTRNLDYNYGSADPAHGGMDCSGFIFYVLTQNGIANVPRDSSQQYVWLRKAGTFNAVNSHQEDTFELDELVPGDLLFWVGTYAIERDPPITHAMIYLGREKGTRQRVMVGASDGRSYKGESRYGVSVFDFKVQGAQRKADEAKATPSFIGYGHVPGL